MAANGITDVEANAILDARIETGFVVDLAATMGSATAAPTLVSGGSYSSQTPTWASAASREKHNSATVTYAGLPAGTINGIDGKHSAGAGGARAWFLPFASAKVVSAGDSVVFAAGGMSFGLANGT